MARELPFYLPGNADAAFRMPQNDSPVLILGSGLTALGVLRTLGRAGIAAYSVCRHDELAAKSKWFRPAPQFNKRIPAPEDLPEYLRGLSLKRAVLIPCSDDWTRAVAELPEDLKHSFPASISTACVIDTMTDKWLFAQMLERENLPRPRTMAVNSIEELLALPESAFENMFLKPLDSQKFSSQTGTKAFQLESRAHAVGIMTQIQRNGGDGFPILLQEYVPGPASSYFLVDGFVDRNGQTQAWIARRRHRMYPAPFGNSTLSETIPLEHVQPAIDALKRIWAVTHYRGIFDAEFKYDDRDAQFKIVEINARPWWFVEFASRCGVDLCSMSYRDALGLPVEPIRRYPAGRRCVYLLYDFAGHRASQPGFRGFLRWLRSLKGAGEIVHCWDDPGPGISLSIRTLRKLFTRLFRVPQWLTPSGAREPAPLLSLDKRRPRF